LPPVAPKLLFFPDPVTSLDINKFIKLEIGPNNNFITRLDISKILRLLIPEE